MVTTTNVSPDVAFERSGRGNDYIGKLASYAGSEMGDIKVAAEAITGRVLSIAIPKGRVTAIQREVIEAARVRARTLGIDLKVTEF